MSDTVQDVYLQNRYTAGDKMDAHLGVSNPATDGEACGQTVVSEGVAKTLHSRVCVLVANRAYGIASSRLLLIARLREAGYRVIVAAAEDPSVEKLVRSGAEFAPVPFRRGGIDPLRDLQALRALAALYRRHRPDLIHHFNTKPIVLGGAVLPKGTSTVINTVTGLGYGLNGHPLVAKLLRMMYRRIMPRAAATIFQNGDDLGFFIEENLVDPERAHLIPSSGVETERFTPSADKERSGQVRVVLVGRMVWQKGVREFAEAARHLQAKFPEAEFCLGGEFDPSHPDAVPQAWVEEAVQQGVFSFLGYVQDMPALLRRTSIFVLPSTFGEGFPRVLLEAGAAGVPVVTSDLPGCREAVLPGRTGEIVPPGEVPALAEAIGRLLRDPERRQAMGREARQHVRTNFERREIIRRTIEVYQKVGVDIPLPGA